MADIDKKITPSKKLSKKQAKKEIFEKLSGALSEYRNQLDKKKFDNKLKKASKLFAVDIAKAFNKKSKKNKTRKITPQK